MLDFKDLILYNKIMEELKNIMAENLISLRKANKLTQLELAEKLNYSDKAVSKWERGESLPDVVILKQLADMYKVSVDYILTTHTEEEKSKYRIPRPELNNKLIITLLACLSVWILVAVLYVNSKVMFGVYYWKLWIWALPISSLILIIFSCIWGKKVHIVASVSLFIWTLLLGVYIQLLQYNLWSLFLMGIPAQLTATLAGKITRKHKN